MTDVEPEAPAKNVVEALTRVMRDLPAIGKAGRADPKQGGYAYRGIEQISVAAQPLLAKHGVIFSPHRILERTSVDIIVNNKPWTDERMTVLWRVYGPGGVEDFIEIETPAIGRDNSDKGANKCMTQAFKYALIPTLCISDSKDDGDGQTFVADGNREPIAAKHDVDVLKARVEQLTPERREAFQNWKNDQGFPWPWTEQALHAMESELEKIAGAGDEGSSEATAPADATVGGAEPSLALGEQPAGDGGEPDSSGTGVHSPAASPPASGYDVWPRVDLEAECKARELPHSGNRDRLIRELRAWDVSYKPDVPEPDARQW